MLQSKTKYQDLIKSLKSFNFLYTPPLENLIPVSGASVKSIKCRAPLEKQEPIIPIDQKNQNYNFRFIKSNDFRWLFEF